MPKRREREEQDWYVEAAEPEPHPCPLCDRIVEKGDGDDHHLVPVQKGGKRGPTVHIHRFCHTKIHATFTNYELAKVYSTVEALRAHPEIAKFIAWVEDKPSSFKVKNDRHNDRPKAKRGA